MDIIVEKKAWKNFVRRVKHRFPKEYIEFIWGEENVTSFRITKFQPIYHTATVSSIDFPDETYLEQDKLAKEEGLKVLGTIHSHPHFADGGASEADHDDAARLGERLMGVIGISKDSNDKFVTTTKWWIPQPPMKFVILEDE